MSRIAQGLARVEKRVLVNLAVFVGLGIVVFAWAALNIVKFDVIERPFRVTAEFASSPGLSPNFQVAYLGRQIGTIDRVELAGDKVVVTLKLLRGTEVPKASAAAVRRQSAVGEPYVDIIPPKADGDTPEGEAQTRDGGLLAEGDRIALARTSTPLAYSELFEALDDVFVAVPPSDLRTLTQELGAGLAGRGESIRQILASADVITTSLADNAELVDAVVTDLTKLVGTLAAHRGSLGAGVDNLALAAQGLRDSGDDIATLLEEGPSITDQVGKILGGAQGDIGCLVEALGTTAERLGGPNGVDAIVRLLDVAPETAKAMKDMTEVIDDNTYLRGMPVFGDGTTAPTAYATERKLPEPPAIRECSEAPTTSQAAPSRPAGSGRGAAAVESAPLDAPSRPDHTQAFPESSTKDASSGVDMLVFLALLAVVAAAAITRIVSARNAAPASSGLRDILKGVRGKR